MDLKILKDKVFYKTLISLALPIVMQNFISSALNMVDTVMIGQLGEGAIASVGLANQVFFLFILICFGTYSGGSIFVSQFWGKKDVANVRRSLGLSAIIGTGVAIIFTIATVFFSKQVMGLLTSDSYTIIQGASYLKIIGISYIFTSLSFAYGFASRSVGNAMLPMMISAIALGINTFLNYILIFGNFGAPKMGVEGAAIATVVARTIEFLLMMVAVYGKKTTLAGSYGEMTDLSEDFVKRFLKTATPVILNEFFWSLGMVMYSVAYAKVGTKAVATVQIANTVQNLFMVISFGIGNASAIMLGNVLGSGDSKKAIEYSWKFTFLSFTVGALVGILLWLMTPVILFAFNVSENMEIQVKKVLVIMAIFMILKTYNSTLVVGILRSGGDTRFSLFLEMGCVWLVGVPLAFLGAVVWKLPVEKIVFLVSLEEVVKTIIGLPRVISKKWVKNLIENL